MESYLALLRALLCRKGMERMRADAQVALRGTGRRQPVACDRVCLRGVSYLLHGEMPTAPTRSWPAPSRSPPILAARAAAAAALAQRAFVAMRPYDVG